MKGLSGAPKSIYRLMNNGGETDKAKKLGRQSGKRALTKGNGEKAQTGVTGNARRTLRKLAPW